MASEFQYRFSEKAESDLDAILSYLAVDLSNAQAASDFLDKFEKTIGVICHFSEVGTLVQNDFLPQTRIRKMVIGKYLLYYLPCIEEKMIYIVRILYGKRDVEKILRRLDYHKQEKDGEE